MEQFQYAVKIKDAGGEWVTIPFNHDDSLSAKVLADRYINGDIVTSHDTEYEIVRRPVGEWEVYTGDLTD